MLTPGLGRSPGEGHGNPLQYSCLESSWTEKAGRLHSLRGCKEVNTTEATFIHYYTTAWRFVNKLDAA